MKKSKLFLSLLSMCFALAVLCFGVYAANQVNYSISGNITYQVEDCYVEVNTKVYTLGTRQYYADLHHIVDATYPSLSESNITIELEDDSELTLTYNSKTTTTFNSQSSNSYSNTTDFDDLEYSTGSGGVYAYIFVINIQNLSSDVNVWAVVDDYTIPANTIYTTNYSQQIIGEYTTDEPSNKNIVFAMALDDPTASIPNNGKAFRIALEIGSGAYSTSDYIKSKLTIEDGVASEKDDEISGVVVIPNGVTALAEYGFEGCEDIIDVYVPISVETIGERVFSGCVSLMTLNLPFTGGDLPSKIDSDHISLYFENYNAENEEYLPNGTYLYASDCDMGYVPLSLKNVSFVYGCTEIPYGAFYNVSLVYDTYIENIFIPSSVTIIKQNAFSGFVALKNIKIPCSVITIESGAFSDCLNLVSFIIPESVTEIGEYAFSRCANIESIIVDEDNEIYDSRNNCNAIIETETNTLILGCKNTIIPSGVLSIGDYAFYDCTGLTSIAIPNSITEIEYGAFYHTGLTSITIPSSVTAISNDVFYDCTNLTTITSYATLDNAYTLPSFDGYHWERNGSTTNTMLLPGTYVKVANS